MRLNNLIRVEAAGAGKTYGICEEALEIVNAASKGKRVLILSYTNRGIDAIKNEIEKQNCGVLSNKIEVYSWYKFLLSDMIKPFQTNLFNINEIKSLDFTEAYGKVNYKRKGTRERYINSSGNIKSNFASELAVLLNQRSKGDVIKRLENIYEHIFIDEVQDMAGYDLNIIEILIMSNIDITCVGDNKQATFRTNNSSKNKKVTGINVWEFFSPMLESNDVKISKNLNSRRFNQEICNFANQVFPNENNISTIMRDVTEHDGVFIIERKDVQNYYRYFQPVVLKYDSKTKTDELISYNFGECKGMTFSRVIIFPNGPFKDFLLKGKVLKSPQKYYVAATRAKYSIAFAFEKLPEQNEIFQEQYINIGDEEIRVLHYICDKHS